MKTSARKDRTLRGFTLVEVITTMTIFTLVTAGALSVFLLGLRSMYKDTQRLSTDSTLRRLTLHVAKETIDATEFYVFPTYEKLDGSVDLANDIAPLDPAEPTTGETQLAAGDCLVLVTRASTSATSNVTGLRIYYRAVTSTAVAGPLRYYYRDCRSAASSDVAALLNTINLKNAPAYPNSFVLAATTRGKPKADGTGYFPVFSTEATVATPTNESVSLNIEVITGTTANNMLSSSSFNYTISPRK